MRETSPTWLRLAFVLVFLAAAWSLWPVLRAPIALDDYTQRALIEGRLVPGRGPLELFDVIAEDTRAPLVDRGAIPWWEYTPGELARFLRPIPSLLVWLDHRIAGYDGFLPHVLSLGCWAAAVAAAFFLFRALLGPRVAVFAAAFFAVSPAHTVPVLWLANRGVLATLILGAMALTWHVRVRAGARPRDELVCAALWSATVLTGEYALCLAGYVLGLELTRRGETLRARLRANACVVVPLLGYLATRALLGYTVRGASFYRSPLEDPLGYLSGAPRGFLVLAGTLWLGVEDQVAISAPFARLVLGALGLLGPVAYAAWRSVRSLPDDARHRATALVIGSLLSLLPVLSARPSMRLLGPAALGACAGLGVILDHVLGAPRKKRRASWLGSTVRWVAIALALAHFVWVPLTTRRFTTLAARQEPEFAKRIAWIENRLAPHHSTVVVLRGTTAPTAFVAPFMLRDAAPERFRVLCQAYGRLTFVRTGARTLEVTQDGNEPIVHFGVGDPVRAFPFRPGEVIDVPGLRVTLGSLDADGLPERARFDFEGDLDDPSYYFITEGAEGFSEVFLPPVGFGMHLAP